MAPILDTEEQKLSLARQRFVKELSGLGTVNGLPTDQRRNVCNPVRMIVIIW